MNKKRVYFDAGHGGSDPGAVKYVKEADVAKTVVKAACAYLNKYCKCKVKEDISDKSTIDISNSANKWKADLFVSVHFNAGGGDGYECYLYDASNIKLGKIFEKHIKAIGQNSRGVKYDPSLNVLSLTNMPAILNEIAFVDNKKDISEFDEKSELTKAGEALAKAAIEYLSIPYEFKVKAKSNLIVREDSDLESKQIRTLVKGKTYKIVKVNSSITRGKLNTGGWITITNKYVEIL